MKICLLVFFLALISCKKDDTTENPIEPENAFSISAVDLSSLPEIDSTGTIFYNQEGSPEDVLTTMENSGVNTIRLRIWNYPATKHSGFDEVKQFSDRIKSMGLKVWLTVHYSDTWADPGHQEPPITWQGLSLNAVSDSVYAYTKKVAEEIQPDIIEIGNEINSGFLFPFGNINTAPAAFLELLDKGVTAARYNSPDSKIMIHFAGIDGADWFFDKIKNIDYDIIGLSYYPYWHGKNLSILQSTMENLSIAYNKEVAIAEMAYPFTLDWNDNTNNIVGLESQLVLPQYPATPQGQQDFIARLKEIVQAVDKGIGFCYWGGEMVAFKGSDATDGSPWENQALYDFGNKALPVLNDFEIPQ